MSSLPSKAALTDSTQNDASSYVFTWNDPFDRSTPVRMVVDRLVESREYMQSIRRFPVPHDAVAIWFFGQNGFVLKNAAGTLFGIDLYLSNSCAMTFADKPFRLDRQLPVFVEPEDLDIDVFITTHSHDDHADPETLRRMNASRVQCFLGPWNSQGVYRECGIPQAQCLLTHPGESITLHDGSKIMATFALPTDNTDLNHTGMLLEFVNGIRFFNTGDTAYAERLHALLPQDVDICAICINGGFHNLSTLHAAAIIKALRPRVGHPLPLRHDDQQHR